LSRILAETPFEASWVESTRNGVVLGDGLVDALERKHAHDLTRLDFSPRQSKSPSIHTKAVTRLQPEHESTPVSDAITPPVVAMPVRHGAKP